MLWWIKHAAFFISVTYWQVTGGWKLAGALEHNNDQMKCIHVC